MDRVTAIVVCVQTRRRLLHSGLPPQGNGTRQLLVKCQEDFTGSLFSFTSPILFFLISRNQRMPGFVRKCLSAFRGSKCVCGQFCVGSVLSALCSSGPHHLSFLFQSSSLVSYFRLCPAAAIATNSGRSDTSLRSASVPKCCFCQKCVSHILMHVKSNTSL